MAERTHWFTIWTAVAKITLHPAATALSTAFFYGYEKLKEETQTQLQSTLEKIQKELQLAEKGSQVTLVHTSPAFFPTSFISFL